MSAPLKMRVRHSEPEVVADFSRAMVLAGITPPAVIVADGRINRFGTSGHKRDDAGWYVLHLDDPAHGAFGDHRTDLNVHWRHNGSNRLLSPRKKAEIAEQAERRRLDATARQGRAAHRAHQMWTSAAPAMPNHPYLRRKAVAPFNARQIGENLILPVCDLEGALYSVQFISPRGEKRFLPGGATRGLVIPIHGNLALPSRVLICEGWATGATLAHEAPTALVLAALNAGNLKLVTENARCRWSEAQIIVCADADPIGRRKGRAAAIAGSALLAIPVFPPGSVGTDFNDLAALRAVGGAA